MADHKVIVEFTLNPTEYLATQPAADFDEQTSGGNYPDTQAAAVELVQAMLAGDADICHTEVLGGLAPIFKAEVHKLAAYDSLHAIEQAIVNFHTHAPGLYIQGNISVKVEDAPTHYIVTVYRNLAAPTLTSGRPVMPAPTAPPTTDGTEI